jgi:hypothetical protein
VTASLVLSVGVDAPVEQTWAGATDWVHQDRWMLGTQVWPTAHDGQGVGGEIAAFTGLSSRGRRVGFLDTMRITLWDPPSRCHVLHTGRLVRGTGAFEVEPRGKDASTFLWREDLELPLGALGRLGWPLVKPVFGMLVQLSLRRFARWVEAGRPVSAR